MFLRNVGCLSADYTALYPRFACPEVRVINSLLAQEENRIIVMSSPELIRNVALEIQVALKLFPVCQVRASTPHRPESAQELCHLFHGRACVTGKTERHQTRMSTCSYTLVGQEGYVGILNCVACCNRREQWRSPCSMKHLFTLSLIKQWPQVAVNFDCNCNIVSPFTEYHVSF
jgi:hypothetical protein